MKSPSEIKQMIQDKKQELLQRRPKYAVYEFIGFLDALQKLELITISDAYQHSIDFAERF